MAHLQNIEGRSPSGQKNRRWSIIFIGGGDREMAKPKSEYPNNNGERFSQGNPIFGEGKSSHDWLQNGDGNQVSIWGKSVWSFPQIGGDPKIGERRMSGRPTGKTIFSVRKIQSGHNLLQIAVSPNQGSQNGEWDQQDTAPLPRWPVPNMPKKGIFDLKVDF